MAEEGDRDRHLFAVAVVGACLLGVAVRALHLDIPMRYDETVTYLSYASRGWEHVTTNYQNPNNHVFNSLLVSWLTTWLGSSPFVIRLPAFLAGCALVPAAAWVGYMAHGRAVGVLSAVFVATAPVLIEFSTNARGYALMSLCSLLAVGTGLALLRGRGWLAWLALVELGVVGLYTLPTMAIPWLGITLWLAVSFWGEGPEARTGRLASLIGVNAVVGAVVVVLYSGIISSQGVEAIVGNRFVEPEALGSFLASVPATVIGVGGHWLRGVPLLLAAVILAAAGAGAWLGKDRREWPRLLAALLVGAALVMVLTRNWGEPRIWLWAAPLAWITAAMGVVELGRRLAAARPARPAFVVGAAWTAVMCAQLLWGQPVRASSETGAVPEVPDVFDAIMDQYRLGDHIVGDFVSVEPLRYYLERWTESNEPPARSEFERVWIVLNENDSSRSDQVRSRVARMGAPPLASSNPVLTVGNVSVYLFGRPAGSADPRLLEAIDWHTGVAGRVDDERALALLYDLISETGSPRARMWLARCSLLGCMGLEPRAPADAAAAATLAAEIGELSLAGDVEAAFLTGAAHEGGIGVAVDAEEAVRWYRRAAQAGHVTAARSLGDAYLDGRGVEQDAEEAVLWWRTAAEAGDATAERRLGEAYELGRGVTADDQVALNWYRRASERGEAVAREALRRLGER